MYTILELLAEFSRYATGVASQDKVFTAVACVLFLAGFVPLCGLQGFFSAVLWMVVFPFIALFGGFVLHKYLG